METKVEAKYKEKVRRRCGFMNDIEVSVEGLSGGLFLA